MTLLSFRWSEFESRFIGNNSGFWSLFVNIWNRCAEVLILTPLADVSYRQLERFGAVVVVALWSQPASPTP